MNTPTKPIMGNVEETYPGSNIYYFSFGGVPRSDWSGRDNSSNTPVTDLCYRPIDPVAGQKRSVYRSKGIQNKLKKGSKLSEFQREVTDHLVRYGLDTISYLPDPKEENKVRSVVTHHARYTSDTLKAVKLSKEIQGKCDSWDKKHDYEAKLFLMDSLEPEVRESFLVTSYDINESFAATWLKLVHYLPTTSSKSYDILKEQIRNLRPQQYSGQEFYVLSRILLLLERLIFVVSTTLNT